MNARLLAAAVGLLVLGALALRGSGRGAAWAPFPPAPARPGVVTPRPARPPRPEATPWAPSRNLFQYADGGAAGPASIPPAPLMAPRASPSASPVPPPVTTPAVRVAGLIRRGGELKAALVVDGEMTLAGKGERAGGYTVLAVDDEAGVRLRGPDGKETVLPPPPF